MLQVQPEQGEKDVLLHILNVQLKFFIERHPSVPTLQHQMSLQTRQLIRKGFRKFMLFLLLSINLTDTKHCLTPQTVINYSNVENKT